MQPKPEPRAASPNHGAVIWLTGLSGAGKTTIGSALVARLTEQGVRATLLDGDVIRNAAGNVGFEKEDRLRHIEAVGRQAALLEAGGTVAVVSLISPYRAGRQTAREMCQRFIEVFVATPLAECEHRDPKGLYARARAGEIRQFTGIDDPYEAPLAPEVTIPFGTTVEGAVEAIRRQLAAVIG